MDDNTERFVTTLQSSIELNEKIKLSALGSKIRPSVLVISVPSLNFKSGSHYPGGVFSKMAGTFEHHFLITKFPRLSKATTCF